MTAIPPPTAEDLARDLDVEYSFYSTSGLKVTSDVKTMGLIRRCAAAETERDKLKAIINEETPCLPGCDSYGHEDECPYVSLVEGYKLCMAKLAAADARVKELLAEVREWLCDSCHTVYPGPPSQGFDCVVCRQCDGDCGPRRSMELRSAEARVKELEAERDTLLGKVDIAEFKGYVAGRASLDECDEDGEPV